MLDPLGRSRSAIATSNSSRSRSRRGPERPPAPRLGPAPLQGAAQNGDAELVDRPLAAGADPGAADDAGTMAADLARKAGSTRRSRQRLDALGATGS